MRRVCTGTSVRHEKTVRELVGGPCLVDSVETFIFDCDGVIWKGDSLIEGVPETIDMLRAMGEAPARPAGIQTAQWNISCPAVRPGAFRNRPTETLLRTRLIPGAIP